MVSLAIMLLVSGGCRLIAPYDIADFAEEDLTKSEPDTLVADLGIDAEVDTMVADLGIDAKVKRDQALPDTMAKIDASPVCSGKPKGSPPTLSCIPTTVGTCKNGSTITVVVPTYKNSISFTTSVKHMSGQHIGIGSIVPAKGMLPMCNGNLTLSWTLPGQIGGDITGLRLSITFANGSGDAYTTSVMLITVR